MTAWITETLGETTLREASTTVGRNLLSDVNNVARPQPNAEFQFVAQTLELAAFTLLDEVDKKNELRIAAEQAFEHLRALRDQDAQIDHLLRTACYGVLADRTPHVSRYLKEVNLPSIQIEGPDWGAAVRNSVIVLWLRLVRKKGWDDLDAVLNGVVTLREAQARYESQYLEAQADDARSAAWELVAIYHLAKAAEILATFTTQGSASGTFDIREQLQGQFDRCATACERAELTELFATTKLLARTAEQLVANSIWTVTRAVNSRVTRFVSSLVDRARQNPLFEMLPPQRITLREHGLLGSGQRSVVVSLPTSSGKTLIAQFRILQALNQFDAERGWVAYVAPTRALVNQICARLRRDFEPLGVVVEKVSPALEIDGVEAEILASKDPLTEFRVLVGTPEKIDLLLRGGWEGKIGRPLTLVVVDEAHNLSQGERGIRLELLLATINREFRHSQFLLLTPFISNSSEVAKWLSPDSNADIGVQFQWKPNDRAITVAQAKKAQGSKQFSLNLSTVHTSRETIDVTGDLELCVGQPLGLTWSEVRASQLKISAATARCLNHRGTTIVVASKVPHTWSLARTLSSGIDKERGADAAPAPSADVNFVCDFVADEFGEDFELIPFLKNGVGLHHSGLSDETRVLMEWLVERGQLSSLVATTTIAQGVNFPVSGVILAGHQYPYGKDMPPEDFWNLAGRAGRADQAGLGIIALAAANDAKAEKLREYVQRNVSNLNSILVAMVEEVLSKGQLELQTLFYKKEWSAFLQYLAHSYRQIGDHSTFASQIEQVLRGSFGFQKIRQQNAGAANALVTAVQKYAAILRGKPLALVDSTGFSWESVSLAMAGIRDVKFSPDMWQGDRLFSDGNGELAKAFGVLFKVPEIRSELGDAIGSKGPNGDLLARIVKDWVHGASIPELATAYFPESDRTESITNACRSVYGSLIQTASWGLSALQSLTIGPTIEKLSSDDQRSVRNLPSRIYYGVNSDDAIDLRLLGVPRKAAQPLADALATRDGSRGLSSLRTRLSSLDDAGWRNAVGPVGPTYRRAWRVIEGRD